MVLTWLERRKKNTSNTQRKRNGTQKKIQEQNYAALASLMLYKSELNPWYISGPTKILSKNWRRSKRVAYPALSLYMYIILLCCKAFFLLFFIFVIFFLFLLLNPQVNTHKHTQNELNMKMFPRSFFFFFFFLLDFIYILLHTIKYFSFAEKLSID